MGQQQMVHFSQYPWAQSENRRRGLFPFHSGYRCHADGSRERVDQQAKSYVGHASTLIHTTYQRLRPEDLEGCTDAVG